MGGYIAATRHASISRGWNILKIRRSIKISFSLFFFFFFPLRSYRIAGLVIKRCYIPPFFPRFLIADIRIFHQFQFSTFSSSEKSSNKSSRDQEISRKKFKILKFVDKFRSREKKGRRERTDLDNIRFSVLSNNLLNQTNESKGNI